MASARSLSVDALLYASAEDVNGRERVLDTAKVPTTTPTSTCRNSEQTFNYEPFNRSNFNICY